MKKTLITLSVFLTLLFNRAFAGKIDVSGSAGAQLANAIAQLRID